MESNSNKSTWKTALLTLCGALALVTSACAGELQTGDGFGPGNDPNAGVDAGVEDPGEDPGDTTTAESTAEGLFKNNVHPIISASCSPGGACHSSQDPAFVGPDRNSAYNTVKIHKDRLFANYNPATAELINKGGGGHYGASFDDADIEAITAWLNTEAQEAAGQPEEASPLAIWSGCMNLQDWENEGVAGGWANKNAGNDSGRCEACHNLGADGFIASDQSQRVFDVITTSAAFMPSYFTLDATGTQVVINRARLEKVGNQVAPHDQHGPFNVDGDAYDRLQRFYNLTLQRQAAGQCDPPRF